MTRGEATRNLGAVIAVLLVTICTGCRAYNSAKQVRTVADLQSMCARIEGDKKENRPPDEARIRMLVGQVANGRDAWGYPILVATRDTLAGSRYLLVSTGSDGQLDVSAPARYFDQIPADAREIAVARATKVKGNSS